MAIAPNTTFVANNVLTAAQQNAFGFGIVAKGTAIGNTGLTTTETVQVTASTFTAIANRYYKITYYEPAVVPAAGATNYVLTKIKLTNTAGTQYASGQHQMSGASATGISVTVVTIQTLTAGSTVIVGTAVVNGGAGNMYRAADSPALLLVEDIGPA